MPKIKRLHYKDINGLRFIALIPASVFVCLSLLKSSKSVVSIELTNLFEQISIGSLDFFFFLSAFLLTSLALREYKYKQSFSLKKFYIRRLLRILPLLLFSFAFAFYFHNKIIDFLKLTPIKIAPIKSYALGVPNFVNEYNDNTFIYLLSIWVAFMFLQFYLVWGFVLKLLKSNLILVGIICIIIGLVVRIAYIYNDTIFYYNPLSYGVSIGFATIISTFLRQKENFKNKIKTLSKRKIRLFYFVGLLLLVTMYPIAKNSFLSSLIPLIFSLFFSFIIIEQTYSKQSIIKLRKHKLIIRLGKITYGFFIFLPIIATILLIAFESIDKGLESPIYKVLFVIATIILTWITADLSYNTIEKVFSTIRRDFKRV